MVDGTEQALAFNRPIEAIARVCHEVNRAICATFGHDVQSHWDEAPEWQRASALAGVRFALDNPGASPSAQHEAWVQAKIADGWTFGLVKDAVARTHPCIVPYEELSADQRVKDNTFRSVVASMTLAASGAGDQGPRTVNDLFATFRAELQKQGDSRELSVALTHLDTARLWAREHAAR